MAPMAKAEAAQRPTAAVKVSAAPHLRILRGSVSLLALTRCAGRPFSEEAGPKCPARRAAAAAAGIQEDDLSAASLSLIQKQRARAAMASEPSTSTTTRAPPAGRVRAAQGADMTVPVPLEGGLLDAEPFAQPSFAFVHIAKCAGTSFVLALAKLARAKGVHVFHNGLRPSDDPVRSLASWWERKPVCPPKHEATFWFEEVCAKGLDLMRACRIPEATLLRDPIARTVSHYEFYVDGHAKGHNWLLRPEESPDDLARRASPDTCSHVETLCDKGDALLTYEKCWLWKFDCGVWVNHQTLVLAGARPESETLEQRYEIAKDYLDKSLFFGLTEYYRESMCLVVDSLFPDDTEHFDPCCRGEEPGPECKLVKVFNKAQQGKELHHGEMEFKYQETYLANPKTVDALLKGNVLDCKLYTYALHIFAGKIAALNERRDTALGPVVVPAPGVDFCQEKYGGRVVAAAD